MSMNTPQKTRVFVAFVGWVRRVQTRRFHLAPASPRAVTHHAGVTPRTVGYDAHEASWKSIGSEVMRV